MDYAIALPMRSWAAEIVTPATYTGRGEAMVTVEQLAPYTWAIRGDESPVPFVVTADLDRRGDACSVVLPVAEVEVARRVIAGIVGSQGLGNRADGGAVRAALFGRTDGRAAEVPGVSSQTVRQALCVAGVGDARDVAVLVLLVVPVRPRMLDIHLAVDSAGPDVVFAFDVVPGELPRTLVLVLERREVL